MNFAKAAIRSAIALISKAMVIIFMVFPHFVRLDWRDMSETKSRLSEQNGQGRAAAQR
jgi:hypothetical protein